jgi:hypothetical protein
MGVDITAFIEVFDHGFFSSYSKVDIARNSRLFEALKTFPPRGLPESIGHFTEQAFFLYVIGPEEETGHKGESYILLAEADEYVSGGKSFYKKIKQMVYEKSWVSNPDYFDASWLTLAELETVLERYQQKDGNTVNWDFLVVLETMRSIEKHVGQGKTRLVFWFDA